MQEPKTENTLTKEPVSLEEKLQSKIAFTSKRDGNLEIYVMNADESEQKNLIMLGVLPDTIKIPVNGYKK